MAPRKSKKDKSKGNKEKNDGSSSKLKPPPPPAPAAAAAAATATASKKISTKSLQESKKKKMANEKSLLHIPHPYMMEYHKNHERTLEQVQKMEESVLLKLIDRSKWRSYPSGPQQCYEKSNIDVDFDFDFDLTTNTYIPGSGSGSRITHLKIIDNTFYERLQLILAFHDAAAAQANNANARINHVQLPRIIGPRPMWRMTKDIAIMDRLKVIELYRCTGRLPKSMNYLNRLTRLQLDGCHDIDLSLLVTTYNPTGGGTLRGLIELNITDCENLTPSKFQYLSKLRHIKLMRWDKSNNNTMNLGKRWINELSLVVTTTEASVLPTVASTSTSLTASSTNDNNTGNNTDNNVPVQPLKFKFQFRCSLHYLTFSGLCITNKDLGNIIFNMLCKFPNLHTLVINDNPEINSFKEVLQLQQQYNTAPTPTMSRTNLKTLKLSGTRIKVNSEELDSVIYFLEKLYPTVGIMKVFSYDACKGKDGVVSFRENGLAVTHIHNKRMILLPSDQRKKINKIEYLLAMNSTNAFELTGTTAGNSQINDSQIAPSLSYPTMETNHQHHHHHHQQQHHKQLPLSVWPLALYKAFRKSYRTCNQDSTMEDEDTFRKEIRYDVVYHLLRNGPIFSSNHTQRYKRRREYHSRGCKKIKAC